MSTDGQQALLAAVQQTVIDHLARHSEPAKVVTISLAPNGPAAPPVRALRRAVAWPPMAEQGICPSPTGESPDAQIIGFIGADGVVGSIAPPIPLTDEMRGA